MTINLPAGTRFIFYGIQNVTTAAHITTNLNDFCWLPDPAFFNIAAVNPDLQTEYFHYSQSGVVRFEDRHFGGDRDLNDLEECNIENFPVPC